MHTHLDNCAHHAPTGSHHSMCTCNSLGCSCTRGHIRRCIQLHTRQHLQRENEQGYEELQSREKTDAALKSVS